MYDMITSLDAINLARSRVEESFNEHPEWDALLKDIEAGLKDMCRRIVRLNGMTIRCGPGDNYDLEQYVEIKTIKKKKKIKDEIPVYKKTFRGKEVLDHIEYEEHWEEYEVVEPNEKDILNLGFALVTLLKLNGFQITDETYRNDNVDSRLLSFVINLGGTENGTQ